MYTCGHRNMRPLPARVSREVPRSILTFEMLLGTLDATRKVTRLSLKESTEVPGTTYGKKALKQSSREKLKLLTFIVRFPTELYNGGGVGSIGEPVQGFQPLKV